MKWILRLWRSLLCGCLLCLCPLLAMAEPVESWPSFVASVRTEALNQGISPGFFDSVFRTVRVPSAQVIHFSHSQPEHRLTFLQYRQSRVDAYRVMLGRQEFRKNHDLLYQIGRQYGVSPCFITALWGLESSYGRVMGNFPVIQSLATLAYESERKTFFRKQLLMALHIVADGHVALKDFKGEWAGASGQPQFMPLSWAQYAVDYTGDGHRDIWTNKADVFASIANYLAKSGWQTDAPWAIEVVVPSQAASFINSHQALSLSQWQGMGVSTVDNRPWPHLNTTAQLIQPDGGPAFLIFNNFNVIMKWNHSTYYAGTVGFLAERICGRPIQ